MICIARVCNGIAERAAIVLAARAVRVAVIIRRRRRDERDVDVEFPRLNRARASAVTADDRRCLQLSCRDDLADSSAYARGLDADDLPFLDVIRKQILRTAEGGGRNRQILQPHLLHEHLHDHARHIVAVAEGVVKGHGHAVMRAAFLTRLADGGEHLGCLRFLCAAHGRPRLVEGLAVHVVFSLIDLLAPDKKLLRNLSAHCVFHHCTPL